METAAALRYPTALTRSLQFRAGSRRSAATRSHVFLGSYKSVGVADMSLNHSQRRLTGHRRGNAIRASFADSSSSVPAPIAPLQLESPVGQFLAQILVSHPHLLAAAVETQLEQLHTDHEAEKSKEEPSPSGSDIILYRRIAELKVKERKRALEEILYTLVVQKFVEAGVSLVPSLSQPINNSGVFDRWALQEENFKLLHSGDAFDMIDNHLTLILGKQLTDASAVAAISKLRVLQVYAASVLFGYFLKRVDQRFQLEKSMKTLPWGSAEEEDAIKQVMDNDFRPSAEANVVSHEMGSWSPPSFADGKPSVEMKHSPLRTYVMSLDPETLQRYATVRSKEAFSIIEKHTEALFGRPEIVVTPQGVLDPSKDEPMKISFRGLKRLILEAVTFGAFLWDAESYVDSRYHFVTN